MELLDPLAVEHIALAPRNVLDVPGIDQQNFDASFLQNLIEGDPIHAGRLHRDGVDATGLQPDGQLDEFMSKAPKLSHGLLVPVFGDRHPMTPRSNVDPRCIEMNFLRSFCSRFARFECRWRVLACGLRFISHSFLLMRLQHPRAGMCRGILS